ncbi:MAG: hypothetical protein WCD36_03235, partial [Rhodanobacteraceae bacterium]
MTIKVCLDTDADPAVTVHPKHKDKNKGKDTITWKPDKDQAFTFVSLKFDTTPNPFGKIHVKDHKITVDDDDIGASSVGSFPYTIVVEYKGNTYDTIKRDATGEIMGPVIHN